MSGSRERDQAMERLLRQALPRSADGTDACLDAETLAAWADGGLSGPALDMAQSHVAECARCQALAGSMARIESHAPAPVAAERRKRPWLAWMVPLTAAAATVAIWVVIPRNSTSPPTATTAVQERAVPPTPQGRPASKESDQVRPPAVADTKQADSAAAAQKSDAQARRQSNRELSESSKDTSRREEERSRQSSLRDAPAAAPAAAPPPAAARAQPPVQVDKLEATSRLDYSSARWRIAEARVQRSTDGGQRWTDVSTGVTTPLTALASPLASVIWVVGRGGVVLLSTDAGARWRRLAFPETTDLAAIQASDERTASVTAADGRTFDTTNGGVSWVVRRPVQEF